MANNLMIGISGVRGIVGETLTPELLTRLGTAFGTFMRSGKVVVGRDTRVSGAMVKHSVLAGLISTGCLVIDLDVCTSPSCSLMVEELGASGGIVISGSHNPIEWNALKFLRADGVFLNDSEGRELLNIYYQGNFKKAKWNELKEVREDRTTDERHISKVLKTVDVSLIRKQHFKVALDSCNGAGSGITPKLLDELGCEVVKLHCTPNGLFPHNPEPIFVNLQELCSLVKKTHVDIGFAQDADADRLALVSEKGEYLGEEYSLALLANFILKKKRGVVVTNVSATRAIDDIAAKYKSKVIRTRVGEVNVAEAMKVANAVIGGEGNGGIIDPRVHYVRDSLVGIALILEYLAESKKTISELYSALPEYHIVKQKMECPSEIIPVVTKWLKQKYHKAKFDWTDGIKINFSDSWIHIRPSNTEPIIRIFSEAKLQKTAQKLSSDVVSYINHLLKKQ
ncbi:MAG: phosphoglucosamine mutase [Candidatus Firestonebacteria bacterium]